MVANETFDSWKQRHIQKQWKQPIIVNQNLESKFTKNLLLLINFDNFCGWQLSKSFVRKEIVKTFFLKCNFSPSLFGHDRIKPPFQGNYLCDFVVRDIKIAAYLESPRKINFNLVSDFLSKWKKRVLTISIKVVIYLGLSQKSYQRYFFITEN